jgi:hypothetical protein
MGGQWLSHSPPKPVTIKNAFLALAMADMLPEGLPGEPTSWWVEASIKVAVVLLAAAVVWHLVRTRYAFVVRIRGGVPRLVKGKVTAAFLQALGQVCTESAIRDGWVRGVCRGQEIGLVFSRHIPPPIQ